MCDQSFALPTRLHVLCKSVGTLMIYSHTKVTCLGQMVRLLCIPNRKRKTDFDGLSSYLIFQKNEHHLNKFYTFFEYLLSNIILEYYASTVPVTQPNGLRHSLSSLARQPGMWVRIPLRAWMFNVCVCMCVFLCLCTARGLATSWSPAQGVLPTV
jgi:hypothetical protein